jgi:transcriptional regulator with XRE-family HTH domain
VETKTVAQLRQRMTQRGITQREVARESGIARPNVTAIFNGRQYLGPERRARIEAALDRLECAPIEVRDREGKPTLRIRPL